ncbi:putative phosphoribosyltransferase [Archaeoglobus sulfaticallidus PM70-1]|uniref:Putative phosphoribosyltransferase n=1 Tax=Archaeoglobus sulfaticallidus PM70-1 TaxID=387631 RepID=N0BKB6_9EURY|nr:phosphoribosyltransferase family protein [Archaeoglobus sulfaticallidus]AGK60600.1 putative phosphoribosyltransferase [Archaeoglobus sulfaticallidus PM70-1]
MIRHDKKLYNRFHVFKDREDAGKKLASFIPDFDVVIAIPAGGVPIAVEVARVKKMPLRVLPVSKILLPYTTEAGFGAISMFGDVEINERLASGLDEETIRLQIEKTKEKIERRLKIIPEKFLKYESANSAAIVDDGLASGFTMITAIKAAKRFYREIYVVVPTASTSAVDLVEKKCDGVFVLNLRDIYPYAVADAYEEWHDVSEEEMLECLRNFDPQD